MTRYNIRTFQDGDEEGIVRLFEECFGGYGGYVLRTSEYWRWCCLERPDVEREGVFVVVRSFDEKVVGYAVVGKSGNVWELGYDRQDSEGEVVQLLLEAAVGYLAGLGASLVNVQVPLEDDFVREICGELGFAESRPPDVFLSVLDYRRLLLLLALERKKELEALDEDVEILLKDAPPWMMGKFGVSIRKGAVEALEEGKESTISVETDVFTLSSLLFGQASPFWSWVNRKVRVKPFWKIQSFVKLLSALSLKKRWFIPLSDYG